VTNSSLLDRGPNKALLEDALAELPGNTRTRCAGHKPVELEAAGTLVALLLDADKSVCGPAYDESGAVRDPATLSAASGRVDLCGSRALDSCFWQLAARSVPW